MINDGESEVKARRLTVSAAGGKEVVVVDVGSVLLMRERDGLAQIEVEVGQVVRLCCAVDATARQWPGLGNQRRRDRAARVGRWVLNARRLEDEPYPDESARIKRLRLMSFSIPLLRYINTRGTCLRLRPDE